MKIRSLAIFFVLSSVVTVAFSVLPVIDIQSIHQEIEEVALLKHQLDSLHEEVSAIQGATNFGQWKNTLSDLKKEAWGSSDWLSMIDPEDEDSFSEEESSSEYAALHPRLTPENTESYGKGAGEASTQMFNEKLKLNEASQSMASRAYKEVNQDFQDLHDLGLQIGDLGQDPDLKHAVDLNSRIALLVGSLNVQELRMLTLLNQQWAQNQATTLEEEQDASWYLGQDDQQQKSS
jgi:type IV secretion system protein VirB5